MTFVDMSNEEWDAIRKHHDAWIHMAKLEMQAEEAPAATTAARQPLPVAVENELQKASNALEHQAA